MGLITKLFGKLEEEKTEFETPKVSDEKAGSLSDRTGTTLRKQEEAQAPLDKKGAPELTALEMADKQEWEVKSLPVWQPGDVILDTYEVEDVISGGMGHVYIAEHKGWRKKLAMKSPNEMMLSDRDTFARILREANSWTEMGLHPNIACCYYVRNIEDIPHIVVKYVDGGDLRQWIEAGKCIDYRTNLNLAIQFCHGMEYAHSKGMIHRDIKPENVLMTNDGILKITDFGLVRGQGQGVRSQGSGVRSDDRGSRAEQDGLTTHGTFMGTKGYMAPEQAESAHEVDERADIFSFGVCLYEMFCGNKPYTITYGPTQEAPDPVSLSGDENFPSDLSDALTKCSQWDPSLRYNTFTEIREELSRIYNLLFSEQSPYAELELPDLEADGLNNQGVSFLELGRKDDALACWEKALEINPTHLEATYNLSLIQWRETKIDDREVLRRLKNCGNNPSVNKEVLAECTAKIHAERFDAVSAREVLKDFPGRYDAIFSGVEIGQITYIQTMGGYTKYIASVAVTPDGRYAVSGSGDKTVRLWELETGKCIQTMEGHSKSVNSVAVTPDGRFAVSGSRDKTVRLWELETGECIRTMEGHTKWVESVAVTRDGRVCGIRKRGQDRTSLGACYGGLHPHHGGTQK